MNSKADSLFIILLIDDSPDVRAILREALTLEGYEVAEAADGYAAGTHEGDVCPMGDSTCLPQHFQ